MNLYKASRELLEWWNHMKMIPYKHREMAVAELSARMTLLKEALHQAEGD